MTTKSVAKSEPIATSTMLALRSGGSLKACTPFDTASVPVSATEPDAKARRTRSSVSACVPSFANAASGAAAALRVRADDLEIRKHDDREYDADRDRERHRERERAGTGEREDAHRFLGRVGRGRDVVRGEDREPDLPTDALLLLFGGRETPADEDAVDRRPRAPDPAPALEGALRRDKARRGMSELGRSDDADVTVARPSTLELFTPVEAAQSRRV